MDRAERARREDRSPNAEEPATFALPRPSKTLTALTTSALALPGMVSPARADAPIERATASSSFSYYFEDDIEDEKRDPSIGDSERYEVFTEQLRFDFPVAERVDLGIDFLYEEMSGASPWYVTTGTNGERLQVMSGATIEDTRVDLAGDVDFYMDRGKDTISLGFSMEKDYLSIHAGLGTERSFNDKNTTLNASIATAFDEVDATDAESFPGLRPDHVRKKRSVDLFAGLSQILTRSSTMQFTINYKYSDGYLSDPYKAIAEISGPVRNDQRPGEKNQASFLLRYRHHIEPANASAHADYRFYVDDFGIVSHTAEIAWYQNFMEWLTVAPTVRWYSQSKADFYEPILANGVTPDERSSDFRLSAYGALSARLKVDVELIDLFEYNPPSLLEHVGISEGFDLIASFSYERYISDGDIGLSDVQEADEAPGLVNYQVIAFTLSGRF